MNIFTHNLCIMMNPSSPPQENTTTAKPNEKRSIEYPQQAYEKTQTNQPTNQPPKQNNSTNKDCLSESQAIYEHIHSQSLYHDEPLFPSPRKHYHSKTKRKTVNRISPTSIRENPNQPTNHPNKTTARTRTAYLRDKLYMNRFAHKICILMTPPPPSPTPGPLPPSEENTTTAKPNEKRSIEYPRKANEKTQTNQPTKQNNSTNKNCLPERQSIYEQIRSQNMYLDVPPPPSAPFRRKHYHSQNQTKNGQ